jgi:hypothetical protein
VIAPHFGHSAMNSATPCSGRMIRKNALGFFPSLESFASICDQFTSITV